MYSYYNQICGLSFLQAIDELLSHGADPSLQLTHGVGSALCVASSTEYEHRRTVTQQLALVSIAICKIRHEISTCQGILKVEIDSQIHEIDAFRYFREGFI